MSLVLGDVVAQCVLSTFDRLPQKAKPRLYADGIHEWVPLSGIVLSRQGHAAHECVALGTGMRCLPLSKVQLANGDTLHDWHAEIVAIRAFNLFLVNECKSLLSANAPNSIYVRRRKDQELNQANYQPFTLNDDVEIHMYCSEMPCGDASMELTMRAQPDASPWNRPPQTSLNGRGDFSRLGVVRRKPARPDAPATLSKSCSDKLALKQCTSLLSSVTSLLISPGNAYLSSLIIPSEQHVKTATERAFGETGRMAPLVSAYGMNENRPEEYSFRPFVVKSTQTKFRYSREHSKGPGSNITAMWTPNVQEVLIGGSVQGHKQFSSGGASKICKRNNIKAIWPLLRMLDTPAFMGILSCRTYEEIKKCCLLIPRRRIKEEARQTALQNWLRNDSDDGFTLDDVE